LYRSILVPIDLDERDRSASSLATAATLARAFDASLTLMTVLPDWSILLRAERSPVAVRQLFDSTEARLAALGHKIENAGGLIIRVESGIVYRGILAAAREISADLIVMAPDRSKWTDAILGTTAMRVSRRAHCSVFLVRD